MLTETTIDIGIPDYYHEDLHSHELEKYLYEILERSEQLGVTPNFYIMEFLD